LRGQAAGRPALTPEGQEVTIEARQQEAQGPAGKQVITLDGDVEIAFQTYILRAEHAVYQQETGAIAATGRVTLDGGPHDAHITAGRANYNVKSGTGDFYDVSGTFGALIKGQSVVLTTANPFVIAGAVVHKVSPQRYIVEHGSVTSCPEQNPTWAFHAEKVDVVAGVDARLYHASFQLLKMPLFYFPYAKTPASPVARTSGFLLPSLGESTTKGFIFGDSVYWAINRSNDVTVGAEYFSHRGWSQRLTFRSRPSESSSFELHYFGVLDRGTTVTQTLSNGTKQSVHQDQGGQEVKLVGENSLGGWRMAGDIDYLSSFLFRQAWSETYLQAIDSEVRSVAYLSHNSHGFSLNASAARYQNFYQDPASSAYADQIRILHLPMAEANALEQHAWHSPFVWGADATAGGLQRSEPGFVTANLVGRMELRPWVALPLNWKGWELRPEMALHNTVYSQQISPSPLFPLGVASGDELNRRAVESQVELRPPAMEKTFDQQLFGARLRHVIEPAFIYRYTTGINNFQKIIRFDQTDILANTSEFEYDMVQRLYGRRRSTRNDVGCEESDKAAEKAAPEGQQERPSTSSAVYVPGMTAARAHCEPQGNGPRELLSWEVRQKYYVDERFGGALVNGRRNVFTSTEALTGIAFLDGPRTWSPVVSKLRVETSANTDVQWQMDYDPERGKLNASAIFAEYRVRQYFFGGSHAFFRVPANSVTQKVTNSPVLFNQMRALAGYGDPNKPGISGGASLGYDMDRDFLQYAAAQGTYNTDCCGVSFEYRRISVPGVRVENQYRFAFSLANIGTFGNLRKQERLY
jgi:LPS-assembly protein